MKLAYLVNQFPMASLTFIRREIAALEAMGHEVHRFALRPWAEDLVDPADRTDQRATRYVQRQPKASLAANAVKLAAARPGRFAQAVKLAASLARTGDRSGLHHAAYLVQACTLAGWLEAEGIEHLHVHFGSNPTTVAMLARVLGGPPYSFTVHGPEEFDRAPGLGYDRKVARAAFVAAISSFGRSQLYRWCDRAHWDRVRVIHCGLDRELIEPEPTPIPEAPRLVCVGRLCEQKGQLLLVEAAAELRDRGVAFELVLAGGGEMREAVEARIAQLGLNDRVRVTGWLTGERVRAELQAARAMVLPSFAEGLPVVIMEALALGRPVISTYVAGIPELVEPGLSGWLAPAGSVDALVAAMASAVSAGADELATMGRHGRGAVLERHDAAKESAKLASVIEAYAKGGSA